MNFIEDFSLQTLLAAAGALADRLGIGAALPPLGLEVAPAFAGAASLALAGVLFFMNRRLARRADRLAALVDETTGRLSGMELLISDLTSDASALRERLELVSVRQESTTSAGSRNSLRQAIALSRHGATLRQLVDTCSLSQGEAHLIRTLYGRVEAEPSADLH